MRLVSFLSLNSDVACFPKQCLPLLMNVVVLPRLAEWMFSALLASEKCDQTVVKSHLRNEDKCSLNMSTWRSFIQAWSLWRYNNNCTHDLLAPTCHWLKSYYLNLGYEVHCIQHIKTYCEMSHYIISMIVSPWLHYCQSFTLESDICEVFICSINIIHPSTLFI